MIFLLLNVTGLADKIGAGCKTADFIWAAFSFVFYLIASIVLACYIDCYNGNRLVCGGARSYRVAADVFGFFTTIAYLIEAIVLKKDSPAIMQVPT